MVFDSLDIQSPTDFYNGEGISDDVIQLFGSFVFTLHRYIELCRENFGVTGDIMYDLAIHRGRVAELIKLNVHGVTEISTSVNKLPQDTRIEIRDVENGVQINGNEGQIYRKPQPVSLRSFDRGVSEGTPWSNVPKRRKTPRGPGRAAKKKGIL